MSVEELNHAKSREDDRRRRLLTGYSTTTYSNDAQASSAKIAS
jgi:hypothetical protein